MPHPNTIRRCLTITLFASVLNCAQAQVEQYKIEAEYLARLAELGLETISEGFESSVWDGTHPAKNGFPLSLPEVLSQDVLWEPAAKDVWGSQWSLLQHGLSTTPNWALSGGGGLYENHQGESYPTTIRVSTTEPIFAVGGWFKCNGDSAGFLFEDRTTANEPGYVLPGYGAMYPGDNAGFDHKFIGIVDPAGFTSVVLTGTLEINEKGMIEGGVIFGCDDFTLGVPVGFGTAPCPSDLNGDGIINTADLGLLLAAFGTNDTAVDINNDGVADTADLGILLADFDSTCP